MRIHHTNRLKKSRSHYYSGLETKRELGITATTACRCSCVMCGNERKWFKTITIKERRSILDYLEQCESVDYYIKISKDKYKVK